jgi:hypothetical protein
MMPPPDRDEALVDRLLHSAAVGLPHGGRTLMDHLLGTRAVLDAWRQPERVRRAGLIHSVYTSDVYQQGRVFELSDRKQVRAVAGDEAEELAFWFCGVERRGLLSRLVRAGVPQRGLELRHRQTGERAWLPPRMLAELLIVEMANTIEPPEPGIWEPGRMAMLSRLGRTARAAAEVPPPIFAACTVELDRADDEAASKLYRAARFKLLDDPHEARTLLALVSQHNSWIAEPYLLTGLLALDSGSPREAMTAADAGRVRLREWGVPWDGSRSFAQWDQLAARIKEMSCRAMA